MAELPDNVYNKRLARNEPKLKLWRSAGLLLTYKCNCACAFCYYNCGPDKGGLMPVATAISAWRSLRELAGQAARVHLTGGEPFLYWDRLIEILEAARAEGLGPCDLVETDGFWATSERIAAKRVEALDALGVQRFKISTDPFHQEYVDVDVVRRLAAIATEILGAHRVLVRWREYLDEPVDIRGLNKEQRSQTLADAMQEYRCRFTGRAAELATLAKGESVESIASQSCRKDFLSAKGVHIDPYGNVFSGTCSGIIVGNVNEKPLEQIWREFDPSRAEFVEILFNQGPAGLLENAGKLGYRQSQTYADKCHLCTDIRGFLFEKGLNKTAIGPADCYP